jgi:glyoxylase-like metal-dependent hydrolase (beta-lactamase superfamily II)
VGHRDALVVDPGTRYRGELDRLRRALWRVRGAGGGIQAVFLTHHHGDHAAGAAQIAEEFSAVVVAHPETIDRLGLAAAVQVQVAGEGSRFEVDPGQELVALHTPGHAPGHLCLFEPSRRILLGGDMVPGQGTTLIDPEGGGEMALYLDSLRRLADLEPALILPGHGPPLAEGRAAIERLIEHRCWREQRVLDALSGGAHDLWSLTMEVYSDISPVMLPLGSRSTLAHLLKLEREGRVTRIGPERWSLGT